MGIRAGKLRHIAQNILDELEGWDDDDIVATRCNTYGMDTSTILETPEGFIDPWDIREELDEGCDEEEYL